MRYNPIIRYKRRMRMPSYVSVLNQYWTDIYYNLHYPHKEKVTHQVIRILQHVEKNDSVGISEVASYINVSHNTASENVKRIIKKGYLSKQRDPLDERKVSVCLTDLGREVLYQNTSLDEEKLNSILNELSDNEKGIIEQAFKILSERAKQCM
jgi:DNA-binding MarR family transcriptional regulator